MSSYITVISIRQGMQMAVVSGSVSLRSRSRAAIL